MLFTNNSYGAPFAKDPAAVKYDGKYFLYHTVRYNKKMIGVGIAVSDDGENYTVVGDIPLLLDCEKNGIGAPCAIVLDGVLHLFYQTYGNKERDAICHATSRDGFEFSHMGVVYAPKQSEFSCGRAIDADVCVRDGQLYLYIATRDNDFSKQFLLGASASLSSDFSADAWEAISDKPLLYPTLPWEDKCIEAPATFTRDGKTYMFYGGAYNCSPQQIGLAVSEDGRVFTRVFKLPFLTNGKEGDWNASESGHPYVCECDGRTFLYYQGSPDGGKSWYISKAELGFDKDGLPFIIKSFSPLTTRGAYE